VNNSETLNVNDVGSCFCFFKALILLTDWVTGRGSDLEKPVPLIVKGFLFPALSLTAL